MTPKSTAIQRLKQDYIRLIKDPVPYVTAEPLPSNMFEWHYVIRGPSDSPYKGGYYHGKLVFPREFPFRPPSIYMITPNGRFACNTRLCLSISDFHPDTWNPAWSVSSILTGLLSFMLENTHTTGSIETSASTKRLLAESSGEFNLNSEVFCELFPNIVQVSSTFEHLLTQLTNNFVFISNKFLLHVFEFFLHALLVPQPRQEIRDKLAQSQRQRESTRQNSGHSSGGHDHNAWHISSLFVLAVFSLFAFLVRLVFRFLAE
ncbi:ubiquitin--protein ligase, partial [Opisthorchis viverrini]